MSFLSRLLGRKKQAPPPAVPDPVPQVYGTMDRERMATPILADEVKKTRIDFINTITELGRANAHARQVLAQQTLANVRGK
jgi:hypothetical protein